MTRLSRSPRSARYAARSTAEPAPSAAAPPLRLGSGSLQPAGVEPVRRPSPVLRGRRTNATERTTEHVAHDSVFSLLTGLGEATDRLSVMPGTTGETVTEWATGPLPDGWTVDAAGHWLDDTAPALRFRRPDGRRVVVQSAAAWIGSQPAEPATAERAFGLLREVVRDAWQDQELPLLSSPVSFGRELLQRALPWGSTFPTLDDADQQLIRATSGQGRVEPAGPSAWAELSERFGPTLPRLEVWDGRFAYAALAHELPIGPARHVVGRDACEAAWRPYGRARWLCLVTVPAGWAHVGLLPRAIDAPAGQPRWDYPRRPGTTWEVWADAVEVDLARSCEWRVELLEGMVFGQGRPLDNFARRIVAARERLGLDSSPAAALARVMLRSVLLQTIGSLHGRAPRRIVAAPLSEAQAVPVNASGVRVAGDLLVYETRAERVARPELSHPEWSACIWARARCRLLSAPAAGRTQAGALTLPAASIVAMRTDAVWTTERADWQDDGRAGRYTLRRRIDEPVPTPGTLAELLRLAGDR